MQTRIAFLTLLFVSIIGNFALATGGDGPGNSEVKPIAPLKMISPDKAVATYGDTCSNGANSSDDQTVRDFIALMEKNPKSKLSQIEIQAKNEYRREQEAKAEEVDIWVSDTALAAHVRNGCSDSYNMLTAPVQAQLGSFNGHNVETRYLIVIKDTVEGGKRTLELSSVKPFLIKSGQE